MVVDTDTMIVIVSALAAALSFMAFALPFLNRQEQKQRYRDVIEKRRKALYDTAKKNLGKGQKPADTVSARDSIAGFFKVQQIFGKMGEDLRSQMLQAGIRDPKAPVMFLSARIGLPIFLMGLSLMVMLAGEKEFAGSTVLFVTLGLGLTGFMLPRLLIKNYIDKRQKEISETFPDALDMMLICIQGGIGLEQTIGRVADETAEFSTVLAEELGILSAEMGMLNDRRAALQDFSRRVGSGAAKSFATAMIQAEQYGTSVSQAMRVIADELRDKRMGEAERKAAALPPKLTVPMILFFLPALFIVILGPAFLQTM